MAKTFAPRVLKKDRQRIDPTEVLGSDVFAVSDNKLFQGAKVQEIELKEIRVLGQVRTKFDDKSIRDLAENIQINGLIQPLVLHKDRDGRYRLICGERRYRAMNLIQKNSAPCFVLDNKTEEELLAIQFSENSSREALHYIDKADGILNYQMATNASERKIQVALSLSKSDVHRSLQIAKLSTGIKEAAKKFNIEKYVLLEVDELSNLALREILFAKIEEGELTKRSQLKYLLEKEADQLAGLSIKKLTAEGGNISSTIQ